MRNRQPSCNYQCEFGLKKGCYPPESGKSRIFGSADAGNDTPAQQQRLTAESGAIQGWQKQRRCSSCHT